MIYPSYLLQEIPLACPKENKKKASYYLTLPRKLYQQNPSLGPGSALGSSEASREVVWELVPPPALSSPQATARLASLPIFFLFGHVFCLFPPLRSLGPGYRT